MSTLNSWEPVVRRTGFTVLLFFAGSVFISKAGVNFTAALLVPISLFYLFSYDKRQIWQHRYFLILFLPIVIGLLAAPFSDIGIKGIGYWFKEYRFMFLFIPVAAFVSRNKEIEILGLVLNISALVSVAYVIARHWLGIQPERVFTSFLTIGRHSDLLFSIMLVNISAIILYRFKRRNLIIKSLLGANTLLLFYDLLAMKIAGAWLGLLVGLFVLLFLYNKKLLIPVIIIGGLCSPYLPDSIKTVVKNTADYKNDRSSKARVELNKTGFDYLVDRGTLFTGTGAEHAKKSYLKFMEKQPLSYRETYQFAYRRLPGNFHNSFMQMAVEGGVLFVTVYLGAMLYLVVQMLKRNGQMQLNDKAIILTCASLVSGFFISQFVHGGLLDYASLVSGLMVYSGLVVMARY